MTTATATPARVMLIDSNVLFSRRLTDALRREGLEVVHASQSAYALTMLEWNMPAAILCATNLREMGAFEIAPLLRADPKTAQIPLIAISSGDSSALMEAFRAGCDECVDRRRPPEEIAAHVRNLLFSRQEGFQPTQMLAGSETSLSGNIEHHDLPGVSRCSRRRARRERCTSMRREWTASCSSTRGKSRTRNATRCSATRP